MKVAVKVEHYDDRGDPSPPNNYRPEITVAGVTFLPDGREFGWDVLSCMPKDKANEIARKVAKALGVTPALCD